MSFRDSANRFRDLTERDEDIRKLERKAKLDPVARRALHATKVRIGQAKAAQDPKELGKQYKKDLEDHKRLARTVQSVSSAVKAGATRFKTLVANSGQAYPGSGALGKVMRRRYKKAGKLWDGFAKREKAARETNNYNDADNVARHKLLSRGAEHGTAGQAIQKFLNKQRSKKD